MKRRILFMLFLYCVTAGTTYGQTRVRGNVMDSRGEPVTNASIIVKGVERIGTLSDEKGDFSLTVPAGSDALIISFLGLRTTEVAIKPEVRVILQEDVSMLGEVAVTAEFGMKRLERSMGSDAQIIKGSDISESGRENWVNALQGRVAGMNVTTTNGAPGASSTVILRNLTSISGNNQPLYVIDGIPMNNSTFDPLNVFTGGTERLSVRNLDYASRGSDINPQDIESVTVLKGAAAAALYGSDASNGAIVITTKKGRAGRGRVTYSNSFRWDNAYGIPDIQTKYSNGAYGTTNYYYTASYGGLYPEGMKLYNNVEKVLQTGFTSTNNVSVEGGSDRATIRIGFSQLGQTGVIKTTGYDRTNISVAGKAKVSDWLDVESTMQYSKTKNNKALRGTDGPLYLAMLWPIVDDMSNYMDADGIHMRYPDYYIDHDRLNPLFGLYKNKNQDKTDRFIANVAATFTPIRNTFLRGQVGWDVGMQTFESSLHPYYANNNAGLGSYYLTHSNFSDPTLNIIAGYNNKFLGEKLTFSAQVGYHQLENGITRLTTNGTKFTIADFQSINNVDPLTIVSAQRNTKRRVQAISGQFEFGYRNLAFLTFRGRNDWSSTLPIDNNRYFYPAVEASLVMSDLEFLKPVEFLNYLKLRGSIAHVGKDAAPLSIDPELEATGLTGGGFKYGFTGPNRNLRPEKNTSREFGFETRLFRSRINADFTYYHTHSADQIVQGFRLSYATGFVLNNMNVGTFNSWGWEAHIDGDILRSNHTDLVWNVGINASHGGSRIVYLPDNVTEYYNAYTWNSGNIRNGIMKGFPITTLTGVPYQRNDNGDILIDPQTGLPIMPTQWVVLGDREPKVRFGITTSLTYKDFRLSGVLAGRYKATVVNGTKRVMMTNGKSWESVDLRERKPVIFNGVLKDGNENSKTPTTNTITVDYNAYGASIYGGGDEDWLETNVNYLRIQELRLSYKLPASFLRRIGPVASANLYVVGNDLITWTNYSGIDAVGNTMSAAAGGTGGEGYDVWSLPMPRSIAVGISITFQ